MILLIECLCAGCIFTLLSFQAFSRASLFLHCCMLFCVLFCVCRVWVFFSQLALLRTQHLSTRMKVMGFTFQQDQWMRRVPQQMTFCMYAHMSCHTCGFFCWGHQCLLDLLVCMHLKGHFCNLF
jgi:hypothetical protein